MDLREAGLDRLADQLETAGARGDRQRSGTPRSEAAVVGVATSTWPVWAN
ncbi:MAG: hypothetical protein ACK5N0_12375 [Synechococcaceae cyanobacterium]